MKPPPQPPPRGSSPAERRGTLVGGLPWADAGGERAAERIAPTPGMPVVEDRPTEAQRRVPVHSGPGFAERLDEFVRRSPPFTVSLSLHVIVLLSLALWFVRVRPENRVALDVFAVHEGADALAGVAGAEGAWGVSARGPPTLHGRTFGGGGCGGGGGGGGGPCPIALFSARTHAFKRQGARA